MMTLSNFEMPTIAGQTLNLGDYLGKVILVVNTASACGFTPQFEGLEALHQQFGPRGLVVLGFPCNQFGHQDPGSNDEIAGFCQKNYGVTFTMLQKTEVNGPQASPFFQWLKKEAPGILGTEAIKWNFTKFLIDRGGQVKARFAPTDTPQSLSKAIELLISA
jgi:glutathione peroxidase